MAQRYRHAFADDDRVELPPSAPDGWRHGYHLFVVRVDDRDRVFEELRAGGIGVQVHYVPMYRFTSFGGADGAAFPHCEREFSRMISLPMFPTLDPADQDTVVDTVVAAL